MNASAVGDDHASVVLCEGTSRNGMFRSQCRSKEKSVEKM